MNKIKVLDSVVDAEIKNEIKEASWCEDLVQYATYKCDIEGLIAAGYLFCPKVIQIKDYIFIEKFWYFSDDEDKSLDAINKMEKRFNNNKKEIEMMVNSWSIGDFFTGEYNELMDNERILKQFADMLVFFWQQRVNELFPDKKMVVMLGDDLMGEYGLCITMFEDQDNSR